jgi:hypothetical protein
MCGGREQFGAPIAAIALAFVCVLGGLTAAARADEARREYRLKAAFVYRFLQFTDWPPDAFDAEDAPIVVAVVGDDPFRGGLEQALAGKAVGRRPIQFESVPALAPNANAGMGDGGGAFDCHVLFVSPSLAPQDVLDVLRQVRGTPVLTLSDRGGEFTRAGGVLRLLVEENRVRFEVNLNAVHRQQLKMSAQVLKLARVYEEPAP